MSFLQTFIKNINNERLFTTKNKLLIAVSGGLDSAVLCHLCQKAGYHFAIAHCNFKLRGAESTRDEAFVTTLAKQYAVPIFCTQFDTANYATTHKKSIQVAARELRYNYFDTLVQEHKFDCILTAHHANDNVETVLMNFFKGTGINGLTGIAATQKKLIRPLLFATRSQIENYATENDIAYVEDSSNNKNDYTRNFLRNDWLPAIEKIYPQASVNIINNINRFTDVAYLYNESIAKIKKSLLEYKGNEVHIPILKLAKTKPLPTILYEIIQAYNFAPAQVPEVQKLFDADTGKYINSATHRILKNRQWLIISNNALPTESKHIVVETKNEIVLFENKSIQISTLPYINQYSQSSSVAYLQLKNITFPLLLRKYKQGDYFYPLGMQKKKKLNRFFIDQKLSALQKEEVWVIEDATKKIIWVVGYRIDDRFKVNPGETDILKLSLTH